MKRARCRSGRFAVGAFTSAGDRRVLFCIFAIPPAGPDQFGRITTRQPFVARFAFFRQRNLDDFTVITFGGMMTNGRPQIFQVSPGTASVASFLPIRATRLSVHLAEHFCTPPRVQSLDALLKFPYGGDGVFAFAIDFETIAKLF
jgi:hypothetical protein